MWNILLTYEQTIELLKSEEEEFLAIETPEVYDLWELERLEEEAFEASINAAIDAAEAEEEKAEA